MDGKKLRDYIRSLKKTQENVATILEINRSTLNGWLNEAEFPEERRLVIRKKLKLPTSFFENSFSQVQEENEAYGNASALVECEKEKAVLEETVRQLELRLSEKDSIIKLLSKQITK